MPRVSIFQIKPSRGSATPENKQNYVAHKGYILLKDLLHRSLRYEWLSEETLQTLITPLAQDSPHILYDRGYRTWSSQLHLTRPLGDSVPPNQDWQ